jgi:sugar (pentulose or hexulose) kinase
MSRYITKSLFVEYNAFPKLAWWRWNDPGVYRKVKKIETDEAAEQIMDL